MSWRLLPIICSRAERHRPHVSAGVALDESSLDFDTRTLNTSHGLYNPNKFMWSLCCLFEDYIPPFSARNKHFHGLRPWVISGWELDKPKRGIRGRLIRGVLIINTSEKEPLKTGRVNCFVCCFSSGECSATRSPAPWKTEITWK